MLESREDAKLVKDYYTGLYPKYLEEEFDRWIKPIYKADTAPKLLKLQREKYGDRRIALRQKAYGRWIQYSWEDYYENVKHLSLGLISLGLKARDKVTIIGENKVQWWFASLATQAAHAAAACGAYSDSLPEEIEYQLNNSDSTFVVVEDQEQVDKILQIRDKIPQIKKVVYWDPKGLWNYEDDLLIAFDEVQALGQSYDKEHPGLFEQNIEEGVGDNISFIVYTSGTTGQPKGIVTLQRRFLNSAYNYLALAPSKEGDEFLSMTPLAWPMDVWMLVLRGMLTGGVINFPEKPETIQDNLREIGFRMSYISPRRLDSIVRMVQMKVSDADPIKRLVYNLFMPVGFRIADFKLNRDKPNLFWKIIYGIGYVLLFRPLKDKLGFLKAKMVMSGGAALSPDTLHFLMATGVPVGQLYGLAEGGVCFFHRPEDIALDTAGIPVPGTEVRILGTGEVTYRAPTVTAGYYKNNEATQKLIDDRGWVHTADAGFINEDGHLAIIDRVVDLMRLDDGTSFSPMYIENRLKFSPYIQNAIIVGDGYPYIAAIVSIDYNYVGKWAEDHGIVYSTYIDLAQKPEVYELIKASIERVNQRIPSRTQVKKFVLLYKELDADDAELTRTAKLRRRFVEQKYKDLIDAIYAGVPLYHSEVLVRYRDGKTSTIKTTVAIVEVADKSLEKQGGR